MFSHGTFIYHPDHTIEKFGSPKLVADEMINLGMQHAWLRVHNKNGIWKKSSNMRIADELRSRGIQVGVWGWNDGNDVSQDITNAEQAIKIFEPDAYISDIEHGVNGANWNAEKATRFCRAVKKALDRKPLVVSSFGYIPYHEPEMMTAIDDLVDYFAPQVYWFWFPKEKMLKGKSALKNLAKNNAAAYAKVCLYEWRKVVSKPLVLTGQAYWGEASGWGQKQAEKKLEEFINDFNDFDNLAGLNWWNLADPRAMSNKMRSKIKSANFSSKFDEHQLNSNGNDTLPGSGENIGENTFEIQGSPKPNSRMIAAEGLFFRSTPIGGIEENKITELDYGAVATLTGPQTANGYHPCQIDIDGDETKGFLHSAYLRPVEGDKIERAIAEAVTEWKRFDKGIGWEDREPYSSYINEMWTSVSHPWLSGMDIGQPWSAAFISFILDNADYTKTKFDIRHSTYIHEAIQNEITGADRDFWGYRISDAKPQVGDLVCQWRENKITFDEAETRSKFASHTDLVIAVRPRAVVTLGGNVVNAASGKRGVTVETKVFSLNPDGTLENKRRLFGIMKNRHRDYSDSLV